MAQLRPYQAALLRDIEDAFAEGERRLVVQVPTGGGKTILAAELVRRLHRRVLYVVPSVEILDQTLAKLRAVGVQPEVVRAGVWPALRRQRCVLAMAQTLGKRMVDMHSSPWYPDLVIIDEAHRLLDAHARLLSLFPAPSIALTATPVRLDGKPLQRLWPVLVQGPTVRTLQASGALVPVQTFDAPVGDFRGVRVRGGDYEQTDLERRLLEHSAPIEASRAWAGLLRGRRTIAFCPGRRLSEELVLALRREGARAAHVDAKTPAAERAATLQRLAAGDLDVVSNCGLFIEGLDVPSVDGIILCTSTLSIARYLQMCGRGMRPAKGKRDLVIVDHGRCAVRLGAVDARRDWGRGGLPFGRQ